jgi:hypothetical protein
VGHIKLRGKARAAGVSKSRELLYRHGELHGSVTLDCSDAEVARQSTEHHARPAYWGGIRLLTVVRTHAPREGSREHHENPTSFHVAL